MGAGEGDWKDIEGGIEGLAEEVVGEEGTAGAIWGAELCDMLTGRGCMGLADNIVDDELGCLTTVSGVCTTSEEVMGRRGKRREQERQGDVNGIIH